MEDLFIGFGIEDEFGGGLRGADVFAKGSEEFGRRARGFRDAGAG